MADDSKNKDSFIEEIFTERERYINPYTDFGFKKLFGTEMNKDLLISFLNALFNNEEKVIEDVQYLNSEHLGDGYGDRRAVFDVYCKTKDGGRFIVEMQKAEQTYFKDRSLYYSTFAIREQAPKGKDWDYHLEDVYTVGVLNFKFPSDEYPADKYRHEIKLKDVEDNHVFYPKLTFVYLEMPKFNMTEDELVTMFDKWMFVLRNLSRLLDRPKALQDRIFDRLFEQAEIAKYSPEERREYEVSVKNYWDYNSTMKTAATNASNERAKKIARRMKARGDSAEDIAEMTDLSVEEIDAL
jgi:predicted transposase/invertase (TIGR01784 family)